MKIKWYGHSFFSFTTEEGIVLITDPFDGSIGYKTPRLEADIILVSHGHNDHSYIENITGKKLVVNKPGYHKVNGLNVKGIKTYHDDVEGEERGENIVFTFEIDGLKICHMGDIGHVPTRQQIEEIGEIDILLIPVGGTFTIDASAAQETISFFKPKIVIPMHFKTPDVVQPIAPVDDFLERMGGGEYVNCCFMEVTPKTLPEEQKTFILRYN